MFFFGSLGDTKSFFGGRKKSLINEQIVLGIWGGQRRQGWGFKGWGPEGWTVALSSFPKLFSKKKKKKINFSWGQGFTNVQRAQMCVLHDQKAETWLPTHFQLVVCNMRTLRIP